VYSLNALSLPTTSGKLTFYAVLTAPLNSELRPEASSTSVIQIPEAEAGHSYQSNYWPPTGSPTLVSNIAMRVNLQEGTPLLKLNV
jgi:hypothetical protein